MTIEEINSLARGEFVEALGWVFEQSPWVAERAWERRPFASADAVHAAMRDEVERATPNEKLALLCAHPDLGTRAQLTAASQSEQAGARLGRLSTEELEILRELNSLYRDRFGFPFIYAVRGSTPQDIFIALQIRSDSTREEEFHEALHQVYRIAYFRIGQVIQLPARS